MALEIKRVLLGGGTVVEARNGIQPFVVDLMKPGTGNFGASPIGASVAGSSEVDVVVAAPDLSLEATRLLLQAAGLDPTITS